MIKTKELILLTLAVPLEVKEDVLNKLGELGVIHLKKIDEGWLKNFEKSSEEKHKIEKNYLDYSSVINWLVENNYILQEPLEEKLRNVDLIQDKEIIEKSNKVIEELLSKIRELEELENKKLMELEKKLKFINILEKLGIKNIEELETKNFRPYIFVLTEKQYKEFKKQLKNKDIIDYKESYDEKNKEFYVLVIAKELNVPFNSVTQEVINSLKKEDLKELKEKYLKKLREIKEKIRKLKKEILSLFKKYEGIILPSFKYYKIEMEKLIEGEKIKESKHLLILQGYIPKDKVEELKEAIENITDKYLIEIKKVNEAPSYIEHEKLKPYQDLVEQYGTLKYGWFDPTLVLTVAFSVFYGFIIGDVGYGLIMLILAWFLKNKKGMLKASQILFISSLSAIFFGLIFGEFFSLNIGTGFVERVSPHDIIGLIVFSIVFGLIYLTIGALIAIYFSLKTNSKELLYSNLSFVTFFSSLVSFGFWKFFNFKPLLYLGIALLLISIYYAYKEAGVLGILDISGFIGNVLSFARLAALGIAGSFMGLLINNLVKYLISKGVAWAILGIILAVVLHSLNLIFAIVGGAIHSLRLNYLEFFNRVFLEGKEKFKAFGQSANKIRE